ncbi:MAG: copper chaperone CopZ [Clostridia bacterium]|nr:copper chaperone CopZ [Clostridia bacterium]
MATQTLKVEGMSCSHCENAIKKAVGALQGVNQVLVDLKGKTVTVDFKEDAVTAEAMRSAIEDQGYDVIG